MAAKERGIVFQLKSITKGQQQKQQGVRGSDIVCLRACVCLSPFLRGIMGRIAAITKRRVLD